MIMLALAAIVVGMLVGGFRTREPEITVPQELPAEAVAIIEETWASFIATFPARRDCIGDVTIRLVRTVDGGDASYRPADGTIRIEIPTTPDGLAESLAHELGHHLDSTCDAAGDLGSRLISTQDLGTGISWHGDEGSRWFEIPAEHFAETVVELVAGERVTSAEVFEIEPATLELVRAWGGG